VRRDTSPNGIGRPGSRSSWNEGQGECELCDLFVLSLLELADARARNDEDFSGRIYSLFHAPWGHGLCEIALQFLAKSENMIVHGAGGNIILVSPHFFQRSVAADDAIRIVQQKLQDVNSRAVSPTTLPSRSTSIFFKSTEVLSKLSEPIFDALEV
jgi:hypothetical protein